MNGSTEYGCLLCHDARAVVQYDSAKNAWYTCPRCGCFGVSEEAAFDLVAVLLTDSNHLSAAARMASNSKPPLLFTPENWRDAVRMQKLTRPSQKARNLLEFLYRKTPSFGYGVNVDFHDDWPAVGAVSAEELQALLGHLQRIGQVSSAQGGQALTMEGWQVMDPVAGGIAGRCFVAMSFSDSLKQAFADGIRPAIEDDCRMKAYRIDQEHPKDQISNQILVEIRRAQFVVADFTEQKAGVYFEAGYALALGRDVIWTCNKVELAREKGLHFDTRQFPHIVWETPTELRTQLRDRIRAQIPGAWLVD